MIVKLATNKMTALMEANKLSNSAMTLIRERGMFRPAAQIATGLERGNVNLAKKLNTVINPHTFRDKYALGKLTNEGEGILKDNPIGRFITGNRLIKRFRNSGGLSYGDHHTGFIFSNPKQFDKSVVHPNDSITHALVVRHELHERAEKPLTKHLALAPDEGTHNIFVKGVKPRSHVEFVTGNHSNVAVLMKENNDIARLKPYEHTRQNFLGMRHRTLEDIPHKNLLGHNYGESKISPKRFNFGRERINILRQPEYTRSGYNDMIKERRKYLTEQGLDTNSKLVRPNV